ncbi:MAG: methyltransferase domain-containing protein [Methanomassiliicoccales archaeon]|nr:MAG: methyltransferase domain-containing protein [Methanomassiliicoccales archaeon]
MSLKLNLGCGTSPIDGYVNIDHMPGPRVDLVHDITQGLPYEDATVDEIYISHTLEHITEWEHLMPEFHRVLKSGGRLRIIVPHAPNYYTGHVRQFYPYTLDGFIKDRYSAEDRRTLENIPLFEQVDRTIRRRFWFQWHIKHYLGIDIPFPCPIGRPYEIEWDLRKV